MTQHTPGPWDYSRMRLPSHVKDRRCGFVVNQQEQGDGDDLPTRICDMRVPRGIDGFSEGEANARLIAAAPELLEACEQIVWKLNHNFTDGPATISRGDATVLMAVAAIAKAKGQHTTTP